MVARAAAHPTGMASANRDLAANVGNLSVFPVNAWAGVQSQFLGTNCTSLVDRIAYRQFAKKQPRAEEIASERARDRVQSRVDVCGRRRPAGA